jgi:hypothetical protein
MMWKGFMRRSPESCACEEAAGVNPGHACHVSELESAEAAHLTHVREVAQLMPGQQERQQPRIGAMRFITRLLSGRRDISILHGRNSSVKRSNAT